MQMQPNILEMESLGFLFSFFFLFSVNQPVVYAQEMPDDCPVFWGCSIGSMNPGELFGWL